MLVVGPRSWEKCQRNAGLTTLSRKICRVKVHNLRIYRYIGLCSIIVLRGKPEVSTLRKPEISTLRKTEISKLV